MVSPADSSQLAVQLPSKQLHLHVLKHCDWFVPADAFAEPPISYYTGSCKHRLRVVKGAERHDCGHVDQV